MATFDIEHDWELWGFDVSSRFMYYVLTMLTISGKSLSAKFLYPRIWQISFFQDRRGLGGNVDSIFNLKTTLSNQMRKIFPIM